MKRPKSDSQIINDFLLLAAKRLERAETETIKKVLETGFSQTKKILNGFIELQVRPGRNGEVIVKRKLDEKVLMKAIFKKIEEKSKNGG